MKDQIIREIEQSMLSYLDNAQMKQLHAALEHAFFNKTVSPIDAAEAVEEESAGYVPGSKAGGGMQRKDHPLLQNYSDKDADGSGPSNCPHHDGRSEKLPGAVSARNGV